MDNTEITADDLLAEIEQETLQSLLLSVRHDDADENEESDSVASRDQRKPSLLLKRGSVVELQGAAGSGKTQLVYAAIITCILPPNHSGINLHGWGKAAFIIDLDDGFDMHRLHFLLKTRIVTSFGSHRHTALLRGDPSQIQEDIMHEALLNLHLFRPSSSAQVAATIMHLPKYHHDEPHIQHREMGLVVVDSLSSFYWQDRLITEQLRAGPSSADARTPFRHVLTAIERLRTSHRPTILLTNWGLNPVEKPSPTALSTYPFFRQHLYPFPPDFLDLPHPSTRQGVIPPDVPPAPRPTSTAPPPENPIVPAKALSTLPLTHHVTLVRRAPEPISVEAALESASTSHLMEEREEGAEKQEFEGLVRTPGTTKILRFKLIVQKDNVAIEPEDMFRR